MEPLKKHYEKILLGVVLLGLAVAVTLLPVKVSHEQEALREKREQKLNPHPKPLTNLYEARFDAEYQRVATPAVLNFSTPHNVFNPVLWQKKSDGALIPVRTGNETGPKALETTKVNPLFTSISFESIGASGSNYLIGVVRDAEVSLRKRAKKSSLIEVGQKGDFFTLQSVTNATPDKPTLFLVLNDTGETVAIAADKPFKRADGYSADLKYDPEKRVWPARRVGDRLPFAGDEFTIGAINLVASNQFEVVVSAKSTGKKTIVIYNADTP